MADPTVALFYGEDPFLLRQAALELVQARGLRATEVDAREWQGSELSDLATPSLFGERRALLVSGCQSLPEAGQRELRLYLEAPSPDALLVLTLVSSARSPKLVKEVHAAGGSVKQLSLRRQDLPRWVLDRARARGLSLNSPGAAALVGTVGEDLAALDQSVEQLAAAFPGATVGPEQVHAQFRGTGEQRVWDLCDRAFSGRLPEAMAVLQALLRGREDPLLIVGGIASRMRDLLRVAALPEGLSSSELAEAAGLRFDWQARRYRDQARRYSVGELTSLHARVVEADRMVKGGVPGDVVLGALVSAIAGEPDAALNVTVRVSR